MVETDKVIAKFLIEKTFPFLRRHRLCRSHHHEKIDSTFHYYCILLEKIYNGNIDHYKVIMVLQPGFFFALFFYQKKMTSSLFPFDRF